MKHRLIEAAFCISILGLTAPALAADVTMPDPNYATATAVMNVIKAAAEQELGLNVSTVTTTAVPVIWEAMARNKGEVDIWPDVWLPNQQGLVDKYVKKDGTVKLAANGYEARQGYCVTQVTVDKYGVKSVADLVNPDNAKLFAANGGDKGEIWIGAPGWQSTNIEKVRARDYGFADFFDLQTTDEAISNAALDRAAKADKPWVGYCYSPHQNFARYKLSFLAEPKYDPAKFVVVQPNDDPRWFEKSKVDSSLCEHHGPHRLRGLARAAPARAYRRSRAYEFQPGRYQQMGVRDHRRQEAGGSGRQRLDQGSSRHGREVVRPLKPENRANRGQLDRPRFARD